MISISLNDKIVHYKDDYYGALKDLIGLQLYSIQYQQLSHAKSNIKEQLEQYLEFIELERIYADKATKIILTSLKRKINYFISSMKFYKTS